MVHIFDYRDVRSSNLELKLVVAVYLSERIKICDVM